MYFIIYNIKNCENTHKYKIIITLHSIPKGVNIFQLLIECQEYLTFGHQLKYFIKGKKIKGYLL